MSNRIFTPFPVLKTERLVLRQLVSTDDNEIFALRSNEDVNKYLGRKPAKSIEDVKLFIEAITENVNKNESVYWAICCNTTLIGTVCLFEFTDDRAEIGYELLPNYQGNGVMQEAVVKVLEYCFETIGLHTIEAYTHPDNENSTKLLVKFNFKKQPPVSNNGEVNLMAFKLSKIYYKALPKNLQRN